ncbi:hypothetical protein CKK33_01825 [Mucilaginibacter sp. MD40]|nr:hypothetical protein CKK33_01825 [Mucilaginibacter sp. MD40]
MQSDRANQARLYRDQLITVGDFLEMKNQLIAEFRKLVRSSGNYSGQKWLKAIEVRKLLKISAGKLQYLRDRGQIPFTKLGGVTYYDSDKIEQMMEGHD